MVMALESAMSRLRHRSRHRFRWKSPLPGLEGPSGYYYPSYAASCCLCLNQLQRKVPEVAMRIRTTRVQWSPMKVSRGLEEEEDEEEEEDRRAESLAVPSMVAVALPRKNMFRSAEDAPSHAPREREAAGRESEHSERFERSGRSLLILSHVGRTARAPLSPLPHPRLPASPSATQSPKMPRCHRLRWLGLGDGRGDGRPTCHQADR